MKKKSCLKKIGINIYIIYVNIFLNIYLEDLCIKSSMLNNYFLKYCLV